jgi:hypothetical protein
VPKSSTRQPDHLRMQESSQNLRQKWHWVKLVQVRHGKNK